MSDEPAGAVAPEEKAAQRVPFLSIVMPCLNEERTVEVCVRKARGWLERSGYDGEVIVVDNGSSDRSAQLAGCAGARVVSEARRGYGSALRHGATGSSWATRTIPTSSGSLTRWWHRCWTARTSQLVTG